jgi:hypothetical protein
MRSLIGFHCGLISIKTGNKEKQQAPADKAG